MVSSTSSLEVTAQPTASHVGPATIVPVRTFLLLVRLVGSAPPVQATPMPQASLISQLQGTMHLQVLLNSSNALEVHITL
jgi:hypothetical protein